MKKSRDQLKLLLLQIREDATTIEEEQVAFAEYGRLQTKQITLLNTFHTPNFSPNCVDGYDALLVGGSSDASVLHPNRYPFVNPCRKLLQYCYDQSLPVFASCFGFQIAVLQLGGEVILDRKNAEIGIYAIHQEEEACNDLLFHDIPKKFWAVAGHKERAYRLPEHVIPLAYSLLCPFHAFKLADKPFYAFQFHPEVDRRILIERITRYKERYHVDDRGLQTIIKNAVYDTPYSNGLVAKFIDRIVLP